MELSQYDLDEEWLTLAQHDANIDHAVGELRERCEAHHTRLWMTDELLISHQKIWTIHSKATSQLRDTPYQRSTATLLDTVEHVQRKFANHVPVPAAAHFWVGEVTGLHSMIVDNRGDPRSALHDIWERYQAAAMARKAVGRVPYGTQTTPTQDGPQDDPPFVPTMLRGPIHPPGRAPPPSLQVFEDLWRKSRQGQRED